MSRDISFGQRLDRGWTRMQLMDYYALSENEYDRVLASLTAIRKQGAKK